MNASIWNYDKSYSRQKAHLTITPVISLKTALFFSLPPSFEHLQFGLFFCISFMGWLLSYIWQCSLIVCVLFSLFVYVYCFCHSPIGSHVFCFCSALVRLEVLFFQHCCFEFVVKHCWFMSTGWFRCVRFLCYTVTFRYVMCLYYSMSCIII